MAGCGVLLCCPRVSCYPRPLRSVPCLRIGSGTLHCPVPLHIVLFPRIVLVPLLFCVVVFVVGG